MHAYTMLPPPFLIRVDTETRQRRLARRFIHTIFHRCTMLKQHQRLNSVNIDCWQFDFPSFKFCSSIFRLKNNSGRNSTASHQIFCHYSINCRYFCVGCNVFGFFYFAYLKWSVTNDGISICSNQFYLYIPFNWLFCFNFSLLFFFNCNFKTGIEILKKKKKFVLFPFFVFHFMFDKIRVTGLHFSIF